MNFAVVTFPGSTCDADCYHVIKNVLKEEVEYVWHNDQKLAKKFDCIILPGGASYGDYLRVGAMAGLSPIMKEIKEFAENGGLVLGIGNGFQILTEVGILPGAFIKNKDVKFVCKDAYIKIKNNETSFTNKYNLNQVVKLPVAHEQGNFVCDKETLETLKKDNQIVFKYSHKNGDINADSNFNGSVGSIAGIVNKEGNVLGMMPHPERCSENILGNEAGKLIFASILKDFKGGATSGN